MPNVTKITQMNKIHIVSVNLNDQRSFVLGAYSDIEDAKAAIKTCIDRKNELLQEKLSDGLDTPTPEEFDDHYEDYLFNKHFAKQIYSFSRKEVPLNQSSKKLKFV